MDATLNTTLSALEAKLAALLTSITSSPTAAGAPAATLALLDADDALSNALNTLRTHQTNYTRILRLRAEARGLEDRIRGIAREIGSIGDEISAARNEGDDSDSDDSDESETDNESEDVQMTIDGENKRRQQQQIRPKEVDYKLLLDFARRISKYNVQAAADAATGVDQSSVPRAERAVAMDEQTQEGKEQKDPGLAAVTQEATSWLDATANLTRDASLLPYPTEDRIRMGLMGHLQAAAAEKGGDIEKEVAQVLHPARGSTIETVLHPGRPGEEGSGDASGLAPTGGPLAADQTGAIGGSSANTGRAGGAEQTAKPKAKFDLDLYDPDDDDI